MKTKSNYVCQQCGYSQVGWAGKCPNCDSWGSLVETLEEDSRGSGAKKGSATARPVNLSSVAVSSTLRTKTGISELDNVLGGGLVPGQVVLIAGEPGIGKSTLLLQVAENVGEVVYASGEESAAQIKLRATRLGIKGKKIDLVESNNIDAIIASLSGSKNERLAIVDSIQTVNTSDLTGLPGSVGQVKESAFRLSQFAKKAGMPVFIVGQVTKEGTVAGPAVLAHLVDTVLWFEGETNSPLRILRAVKNRFGSTDEVGLFTMESRGLVSVSGIENFLVSRARNTPGSVIVPVMEGSRPILVDIQSLVVPTKLAFPKRVSQGVDSRRVEVILAVLTRRCGLPMNAWDVFVNAAGGISVREPAADLAIALSLASAFFNKPFAASSVAFGEIGLLGEIRKVEYHDKRVKQASKLGYKNAITYKSASFLSELVKKYFKK